MRRTYAVLVVSTVLAAIVACSSFSGSNDDTPPPGNDAGDAGNPPPPPLDDAGDASKPPCTSAKDTLGLLDPTTGAFTLYADAGPTVVQGTKSDAGYPIAGRWTGGAVGVGSFDQTTATFTLLYLDAGPAGPQFNFGSTTQLPIAGDWNGDKSTTVGVFTPGPRDFFLIDTNAMQAAADYQLTFGESVPDTRPIAGDWDGDGRLGIGVYYPGDGRVFMRNSLTSGIADIQFQVTHTGPDAWPVVGDWDGCGRSLFGIYDQSSKQFFLLRKNEQDAVEDNVPVPSAGPKSLPIAGAF
jgi:hypothetical protein